MPENEEEVKRESSDTLGEYIRRNLRGVVVLGGDGFVVSEWDRTLLHGPKETRQ